MTYQVWAYNPGVNQWIAVEEFKGTSRRFPVAFAIDNKGYFGTGTNGANFNDFWQYNPSINSLEESPLELISFYPNPATEDITFQKLTGSSVNRVFITNNLGQHIHQIALSKELEQLSVSDLPAGIYQVLFYQDDK